MNKKEQLIEMFINKSNEYFLKHRKDIEYSLNNSDLEYIESKNTKELFNRLITCYCANLTEDIKWMSECEEEY